MQSRGSFRPTPCQPGVDEGCAPTETARPARDVRRRMGAVPDDRITW
ncbi:hypothetical protein HNR18_001245 [Pseudoclavibacter caeni]|nr:hypothetical protein [Pseudoclavibacter caeni]